MAPIDRLAGGRPTARPLEIEVVEKFKRYDTKYALARKAMYPHLFKGLPKDGSSGTRSVCWVGLNADPCKAKYLAKSSSTGAITRSRPASAPAGRPPVSQTPASAMALDFDKIADMFDSGAKTQNRLRPSSAPCHRRPGSGGSRTSSSGSSSGYLPKVTAESPRDLSKISCNQHYLEQKIGVGPCAQLLEDFGPNGAWPSCGAVKPDNLEELLYLGTTSDNKGRYAYLKARRTMGPQEKDRQPVTAANDVGWLHHEGKVARSMRPVRPQKISYAFPC